MEHVQLLEDTATIIDVITYNNQQSLVLDQTIFYPQGGGQPYDQGTITGNGNVFEVSEVRFQEGIVYHIGLIRSGSFEKGMTVTLQVNKKRRNFNSRNHTAGHLIDIAMQNVGMDLVPRRGYHFPKGAYIEYVGTLDDSEREGLKIKLQQEVNHLIAKNLPVEIKMVTIDQLKAMASYVPDYIPKDKPIRTMIVQGYPAIPCGGTHAKTSKEVGPLTIDKARNKKGSLRISYSIQP